MKSYGVGGNDTLYCDSYGIDGKYLLEAGNDAT